MMYFQEIILIIGNLKIYSKGFIRKFCTVKHDSHIIKSCLHIQRQIVKDFLIKFTKKVPEAPYGS